MAVYYNEIDPFCAQWLRNLMDAGHIAPGDIDTDDPGWQRREREGESHQARQERSAACRELVRSDRRPWPPGPRLVNTIPELANGVSGTMGGCKAYGNAIVPQIAAELIGAYMDAQRLEQVAA